jgi:hypothetical protein
MDHMERVVICPSCQRTSPQPEGLGLAHACGCGAVFALFSEEELTAGLIKLVDGLSQGGMTPPLELLKNCQVTVFRGYELPAGSVMTGGLAEFIKEIKFTTNQETVVDLVWVARGQPGPSADPLDQSEN